MYVSRLVYLMALLEAVLWIQPNFALSWQHDMTKLLQTQTDNLGQLVQNAAKENIAAAMFQKQLEMVAREQEMIARGNIQVRNTQAALLDKGDTKQKTNVDPAQHMTQLLAGANDGGGENRRGGNAEGTKAATNAGEKGVVANGAVPIISGTQAYAVACCILIACISAFSNDFNIVSESSDSDASSSVAASPSDAAAYKRPHSDEEQEEEGDDNEENDCRRERKRVKLGARVASAVQSNQALKKKKKNYHKRHAKSEDLTPRGESPFSFSEVVSDDSVACSPVVSVSSGAASPKDSRVSSPVPLSPVPSSVFSTLPPEMAGDFEAEHAFYFHGISCPASTPAVTTSTSTSNSNSNSNATMNTLVPIPVSPVRAYTLSSILSSPILDSPMYEHNSVHRVSAIDPALLMEQPSSRQNAGFSASEHSSEVDDDTENTETAVVNTTSAPLFGVSLEPMIQEIFY